MSQIAIMVVYKTSKGLWRGFCFPYDVTCEAETKDRAKKKLEGLVDLYVDGLKKYRYPTHLSFRKLTDSQDRAVFKKMTPEILADLKKRLENFVLRNRISFKEWMNASGGYYFLPLNLVNSNNGRV